jgi:hypothetical protein
MERLKTGKVFLGSDNKKYVYFFCIQDKIVYGGYNNFNEFKNLKQNNFRFIKEVLDEEKDCTEVNFGVLLKKEYLLSLTDDDIVYMVLSRTKYNEKNNHKSNENKTIFSIESVGNLIQGTAFSKNIDHPYEVIGLEVEVYYTFFYDDDDKGKEHIFVLFLIYLDIPLNREVRIEYGESLKRSFGSKEYGSNGDEIIVNRIVRKINTKLDLKKWDVVFE